MYPVMEITLALIRLPYPIPKIIRHHRRTSLETSGDLGCRSLGEKTSDFGDGLSHPSRFDQARPDLGESLSPFAMDLSMGAISILVQPHHLSKSSNPIVLIIIPHRSLILEVTYLVLIIRMSRMNFPH